MTHQEIAGQVIFLLFVLFAEMLVIWWVVNGILPDYYKEWKITGISALIWVLLGLIPTLAIFNVTFNWRF